LVFQDLQAQTLKPGGTKTPVPKSFAIKHLCKESAETQNGLVSKDTSPFNFDY